MGSDEEVLDHLLVVDADGNGHRRMAELAQGRELYAIAGPLPARLSVGVAPTQTVTIASKLGRLPKATEIANCGQFARAVAYQDIGRIDPSRVQVHKAAGQPWRRNIHYGTAAERLSPSEALRAIVIDLDLLCLGQQGRVEQALSRLGCAAKVAAHRKWVGSWAPLLQCAPDAVAGALLTNIIGISSGIVRFSIRKHGTGVDSGSAWFYQNASARWRKRGVAVRFRDCMPRWRNW